MSDLETKEADILSGIVPEYALKHQMKFLLCGACLNHLLLGVVLFIFRRYLPAVYQLGSVFFYTVLIIIASPSNFTVLYILTVVEVSLHVLLMHIFVGANCSFSLYLLLIVPIGICISYTQYSDRTKVFLVSFGSIIACLLYLGTFYLDSQHYTTQVTDYTVRVSLIICNVCAVFLFLTSTTLLFVRQVQAGYVQWENITRSLIREANTDPLTGLLNRRGMQVILSQKYAYWRKNRIPFSLVMGDIDNFKKVNDTYGHDFGDLTLVHISSLIADALRSNDVACRWGGEEFLILIAGSSDNTKIIAERIRQGIESSPVCAKDVELKVTMTFGVAGSESGADLEGIIRMADQNLYFGKEQGKNCVV